MGNPIPPDVDEIVDLEALAVQGHRPPQAKRYRIRVDRTLIVVPGPTITGRGILSAAGKQPVERYRLDQVFRDGRIEKIGLDDTVDLTTPGIERFVTLPLDQTDGSHEDELAPRRQFDLPSSDVQFLERLGCPWETVVDQGQQWLLIDGYPVPTGYQSPPPKSHALAAATLALLISPGYSTSPLDMVYIFPALYRMDGKAIAGLSDQVLDGRVFQRWSRHRTQANPWRPGLDSIATHLSLIEEWLGRELGRRAA